MSDWQDPDQKLKNLEALGASIRKLSRTLVSADETFQRAEKLGIKSTLSAPPQGEPGSNGLSWTLLGPDRQLKTEMLELSGENGNLISIYMALYTEKAPLDPRRDPLRKGRENEENMRALKADIRLAATDQSKEDPLILFDASTPVDVIDKSRPKVGVEYLDASVKGQFPAKKIEFLHDVTRDDSLDLKVDPVVFREGLFLELNKIVEKVIAGLQAHQRDLDKKLRNDFESHSNRVKALFGLGTAPKPSNKHSPS